MAIKRLPESVVCERLHALTEAASLEAAMQALGAVVEAIGFHRFALVNFNGRSEVRHVFHNAPAEWRHAQEDLARLRRDPVIEQASASPIPFPWSRGTYVNAGQLGMWTEQASHGYRAGLGVSCGPADAQMSILVTSAEHNMPNQGPELLRAMADLSLVAVYAYHAVERFAAPALDLRPRELECLDWVLKGKTSWETAQLLGISERTVNQHISRAMEQLGVNKKQMAAMRAAQLGLLPRKLVYS